MMGNLTFWPTTLTNKTHEPFLRPLTRLPLTEQIFFDVFATSAETLLLFAKDDPKSFSAAVSVTVFFTPTVGVPVTVTKTVVDFVLGFFTLAVALGVTDTLSRHVPGFRALMDVPVTLHTDLELPTTLMATLAPFGTATFATLLMAAKEMDLPVLTFASFFTEAGAATGAATGVKALPAPEQFLPLTTTQKLRVASAPLPRMR
jgi:hypothetical protein